MIILDYNRFSEYEPEGEGDFFVWTKGGGAYIGHWDGMWWMFDDAEIIYGVEYWAEIPNIRLMDKYYGKRP